MQRQGYKQNNRYFCYVKIAAPQQNANAGAFSLNKSLTFEKENEFSFYS